MTNLATLLREGRKKDAWLKYCGFIDLSMGEFMDVQERLLQEQVNLLLNSELGRKLLCGNQPRTVADFRSSVPLTTYKDYSEYFLVKREDVLPAKPSHWVCTTSGQTEGFDLKWAPYPEDMVRTHIKNFLSSIIFSQCTRKGDFSLKENFKFLYAMAPPPYLTGMVPYGLKDEFHFNYLPPLHDAEKMDFEERNREGFRLGLIKGIDLFFGVSSVMVRIGEKFSSKDGDASGLKMRSPIAWLRLARGFLTQKSRLGRELLPRDVWNLKGIVCAGTDTSFYKERIEYYWGKKPLEVYGGTEIGIAATQTWDHEGMTLFPDANFWEFIPEAEYHKSKSNPGYEPATVLANELEPGKRYEIVITNFKGGAFVRYRVGDMVKVLSRRNSILGIDIPQILYEDRIEDVIDLAGFTRITERILFEALKKAGITHGNWVANKVFYQGHPVIQLFLEMPCSEGETTWEKTEEKIHLALRAVDSDYHDLEIIMGYRPISLLPIKEGTFKQLRKEEGPDSYSWASGPKSRVNPYESLLKNLSTFSLRSD